VRTIATRIGRTVPAYFEGTVRAVWRRTCAVTPDPAFLAEEGPALVTLVRNDVPMTAASIALELDPGFDFAARGVCAGDRVESDGVTLVLEGASGPLQVDLRGAALYDGLAPEPLHPVDASLLELLADDARRHRTVAGRGTALAVAAAAECDRWLERLSLSVHESDVAAAELAARSLVGLGPGLTPSGDDALCGFMLGRRLSGGAGIADEAVRRVAADAAGLTTDVSSVQLALASRGRFGESLLDVAEALAGGFTPQLRAAVARCLSQGATSGADGLLGLVAGVSL